MKRTALLMPLVAVLSALTPATAARAATGAGMLLWTDGHSFFRSSAEYTDPQPVATEPDGVVASQLATSADGSRFAYIRTTPSNNPVYRTEVVVRDIAGSEPLVVADSGDTTDQYYGPSLSGDGSAVSWLHRADDQFCLEDRLVVAGPYGLQAEHGHCGFGRFQYVPGVGDGRGGLMVDSYGTLRADNIGDDHYGAFKVTGIDQDISTYALSPDGRHLAWSLVFPQAGYDQTEVWLGNFSHFTVSGAHRVLANASGTRLPDLAFSADSSRLYFTKSAATCCHQDDGDLAYIPVSGGPVVQLTDTDTVDEPPVQPLAALPPPPSAPTSRGAALYDDHPTVRWTTTAPSAVTTRVVRTGGGQPTKVTYVPTATSSLADAGLTIGSDYTYTLRSRDAYGQYSAPLVIRLTATATEVTAPEYASDTGSQPPYRVFFPSAASATISWSDLTTHSGFTPWNVAPTGSHAFGLEGGTTSIPGHTYAIRLQVTDKFGNVGFTGPRNDNTTHVPLDQQQMTFTGPTVSLGDRHFWRTTARVLRPGATATIDAPGFVTIIGSTCPTCGSMVVRRGGKVVATVDTSRPRRDRQHLLALYGSGPITITVQAHGSQRDLVLDGYAVGV